VVQPEASGDRPQQSFVTGERDRSTPAGRSSRPARRPRRCPLRRSRTLPFPPRLLTADRRSRRCTDRCTTRCSGVYQRPDPVAH
jgi:hypothetical protein